MDLSPEGRFVQPNVKNPLLKRCYGRKLVTATNGRRGIPPPKPSSFETRLDICCGNLMELFNCHVGNSVGGEVSINLETRHMVKNVKRNVDVECNKIECEEKNERNRR